MKPEKPAELEHTGEHSDGNGIVKVAVNLHGLLNWDKSISACLADLLGHLQYCKVLKNPKYDDKNGEEYGEYVHNVPGFFEVGTRSHCLE